jgi:hypothetical protein
LNRVIEESAYKCLVINLDGAFSSLEELSDVIKSRRDAYGDDGRLVYVVEDSLRSIREIVKNQMPKDKRPLPDDAFPNYFVTTSNEESINKLENDRD